MLPSRFVHHDLVVVGITIAVFVCSLGALTWRAWRGASVADPVMAQLLTLAAVVLEFFAAGVVAIVAEMARDRSRSTEQMLQALPISTTGMQVLLACPSFLIRGAVVFLTVIPGVALFSGSGVSLGNSIIVCGAAFASGLGVIGVCQLAISLLLRRRRWDGVRVPISLLMWLTASGGMVWAAFRDLGGSSPVDAWWPLPGLVGAVSSGQMSPTTGLQAIAFGAIGLGALAVSSRVVQAVSVSSTVRKEWRGTGPAARSVGEGVHAARDATLVGNAAVALLLVTAIAAGSVLLPSEVRESVRPTATILVAALAAVPVRAVRGALDVVYPTPRLLGVQPWRFGAGQALLTFVLFSALAAPYVFALCLSGSPAGASASIALLLLGGSIATIAASVVVIRNENSVAQAIAAGPTLIIVGIVASASAAIVERQPIAAVFAGVMSLFCAVAIAAWGDHLRWNRRTPSEKEKV
jgi:hypothetical protein